MHRAVLIWSLLVCLALPISGLQGKAVPDPDAETQALIQLLVVERAATLAAFRRVADERERSMLAKLEAKDLQLRSEVGKRKSAQAELLRVTAERHRLVDEIAARDRQLAADIAEYRKQVASIANSPDPRKRAALALYAEGERADRADAVATLVEIQEAETKAVAAGWREIAALAMDLKDRGEMSTEEVLSHYERARGIDPKYPWVWIKLCRLYQEAARLQDAKDAAQRALELAQDDRDRSAAAAELGDVLMAAGDIEGAKARYEEGLAIDQRLAEATNPASKQAQRDLSVSLMKLGDALAAGSDLQGAKARFEESLTLFQRLAKADPKLVGAQHDLSTILNKLGNTAMVAGDLQEAKARFEEGHGIAQRLVRENPTSAEAKRNLSISLEWLGNMLVQDGKLQGAKARFEESLAIRQRLAKDNPTNMEAQRDLSISLNKLGDVLLKDRDLPGAKARFEESLEIRRRLAHDHPTNTQVQRDLSISLDKLGKQLLLDDDRKGAKALFEESLPILQRFAKDYPSAQAQRDLSVCLSTLGRLLLEDGDLPGAKARFEEDLAISRRLAEDDPASAQAQRDLGISLETLGAVLLEEAKARFEDGLAIAQCLANHNPTSAQAQMDLIGSHINLGGLPGGEHHWSEALKIALELQSTGRLDPEYAELIDELKRLAAATGGAEP